MPQGGGAGPAAEEPVKAHDVGDPKMNMHMGYGGTLMTDVPGMSQTLTAGLDRQWSFHRGLVRATGEVGQFFNIEDVDQSQFTFNVGALGSYDWSRRAQLTVNERVTSGYAWQTNAPTETKTLFPQVLTRTNDLSGVLGYLVSP